MNTSTLSTSEDRVVVVTGANTGIGAACALALAAPGTHLVLACRSREKTEPVLEAARARGAQASFHALDLGDAKAAAGSGEALAGRLERLDLLVNNAGLAGKRGLSEQGFEVAFATNHLGHFAFTRPLFSRIERASGRIVNVSSGNHYHPKELDLSEVRKPTQSRTGLHEYGVSKLCNVLFTAEIRRRYPGIEAVAVNPGRIASDIWRSVPQPFRSLLPTLLRMGTVETGGATLVNAARAPLDERTLYFHKLAPKEPSPLARDPRLAETLWTFSERALAPS
jgi:retinol dehydrogenase-12